MPKHDNEGDSEYLTSVESPVQKTWFISQHSKSAIRAHRGNTLSN